ncbi:hypothetical protein STRDD10_00152 [Streptococcus sp. DD10]|nr:hypothetical protein STRDD10_00152 [Streptococcus sp. DD10]
MSDLHIDSNQFGAFEIETLIQTLQDENIDHLHIAGDISNDFKNISQPFINQLCHHFPVSYNLGNHDMLGMSEEEIRQREIQIQQFGDRQLVSLSGWYDYSFVPEKSEEEHLKNKLLYWFDRRLERTESDPTITNHILSQLESVLQQTTSPILLSLHFVPHDDFILHHPYFERFNAFLGSRHFHTVFKKYPITDVIFGHTHHRFGSRMVEGIRYHARPLGYVREWELCKDFLKTFPSYRFKEDYHPYKRYRKIQHVPEFIEFKKKQLKKEFQDALTILDL